MQKSEQFHIPAWCGANNLRQYSARQPSGIDWLGDVPAHWQARRLKTVLTERVEKGFPDEALLAATQAKGVVRKEQYENRTVLALKDLHLLKLVHVGDFVISLRSFQGGIEYAHERGIISPAYTILYSIDTTMGEYLAKLFKSGPFIENLSLHVTGIREGQNIDYSRLRVSRIPIPPLDEQRTIVRYLDRADERIQRAISAKERLIELLTEQRQAVIHQAVTRGLDPNVRLKDSGVEWLGEVPEHWDVRRLRNIVDMRVSNVDKHIKEGELPVRLCNYVDVYKNERITDSVTFMHATATSNEVARFNLELEDVLITKDSETWDDIGVPALVKYTASDLVCGYHVAVLRPLKLSLVGGFLLRALQSSQIASQFSVSASGVTRYGLTHEAIKSVLLPLPPLDEQYVIIRYLDRATTNIDAAIDNAQRQTDLLREYRTRLIADVVTGQVDVRGAVEDEAELPVS